MIDGGEKRNRQLGFELQNVCEKHSNLEDVKKKTHDEVLSAKVSSVKILTLLIITLN